MGIPTDSSPWQNGSEPSMLKEEILDYLRDNPDEAFSIRELADEVADTDWTDPYAWAGGDDGMEGLSTLIARAVSDYVATNNVKRLVSELKVEGEVEIQKCRTEDLPDHLLHTENTDEVDLVTFAGSSD